MPRWLLGTLLGMLLPAGEASAMQIQWEQLPDGSLGQTIEFHGKLGGVPVAAYIRKPNNGSGPFPVVMILHGVISIKAPPLVEPGSKWHQVQQAWGRLFPTAMAGDLEYFKANDPFNLAVQNAAKLRDHAYIRLTTHILIGENWIQARVEALHQQLLTNHIPHKYHLYESVKSHSPTGVFACQGDIAFDFFNSISPQLRNGSLTR